MRKKAGFSIILLVTFCVVCAASKMSTQPVAAKNGNLATPTPSPVIPTTPVGGQTLDSLQSKIRQRISIPEVTRGRVGIKIVSLNTGKVVLENDADKYFIPASNMKNFTVAAALEELGPDFRFVTSVYANAKPDATGTIKGDLRIYGRGDVSISTAFNNGDYYKGLDNLVDKIAAAGVRRIEGSLVGDESYFHGNAVPLTWEWDDLQTYDGAEISAFPINNNAVDLTVSGTSPGGPCNVTLLPLNSIYRTTNACTTSGPRSGRGVTVKKSLEQNSVIVSGSMPAGDSWTSYIAVTHPADLFLALLKERLEKRGITVMGTGRTTAIPDPQMSVQEVTRLESPPLLEVAAKTMKPSQNMFTETLLWTLGEESAGGAQRASQPADQRPDSAPLGLQRVREFLADAGVSPGTVVQYDGSGMSRHDLVTPNAVVTLYTYMAKRSRNAQVWRDSLAVGGVDGTLRNRFKGTIVANNFRGKTGTLDQVSALSGYVTTSAGEQLVVSILVNNVAELRTRISLIDDIVIALAGFKGRIDQ